MYFRKNSHQADSHHQFAIKILAKIISSRRQKVQSRQKDPHSRHQKAQDIRKQAAHSTSEKAVVQHQVFCKKQQLQVQLVL